MKVRPSSFTSRSTIANPSGPFSAIWMSAPNPRAMARRSGLAVFSTAIRAGAPTALAAKAAAIAWLPALTAVMPRALCSGDSDSAQVSAPRALNVPVACNSSSFRNSFASSPSSRAKVAEAHGTVGVRTRCGASSACVARMSASEGQSLSIDQPVPHVIEIVEEAQLERLLEERDAAGAAGAGLVTDHALDRAHMVEAPALEQHLHVHQLFGEVVEVPVVLWPAIDCEPGLQHRLVPGERLAPVALDHGGRQLEAAPRQQLQHLVIEGRLGQRRFQPLDDFRIVAVHLDVVRILVAEDVFDQAIAPALEPGRGAEQVAEGEIVRRRHGVQHLPGRDQL